MFITEQVERQAYEILERFADHPFSFVDATSFALMRQQRIRHAFAFDIHFATAGFLRVPADVRLTE
jgi:predicted nucleic acid-binding protein